MYFVNKPGELDMGLPPPWGITFIVVKGAMQAAKKGKQSIVIPRYDTYKLSVLRILLMGWNIMTKNKLVRKEFILLIIQYSNLSSKAMRVGTQAR